MLLPAQAKKEMAALLGPRGYLDRPEDLLLYEYDGADDTVELISVVDARRDLSELF